MAGWLCAVAAAQTPLRLAAITAAGLPIAGACVALRVDGTTMPLGNTGPDGAFLVTLPAGDGMAEITVRTTAGAAATLAVERDRGSAALPRLLCEATMDGSGIFTLTGAPPGPLRLDRVAPDAPRAMQRPPWVEAGRGERLGDYHASGDKPAALQVAVPRWPGFKPGPK